VIAHDLGARQLCRGIRTFPLGLHCELPAGYDAPTDETNIGGFLDGLRRSVEHGATFLDTADSYGLGASERVIGRFMREQRHPPIHLSSKVGQVRGTAPHPFAGRHIHHQLEQSVENLEAEYLDLYTLDSFDFGPGDRYLGDAIDMMRTLRELESIKAIGMRGPYTDYVAPPEVWEAQAERFLYLFRLIKPDVVWTRFNAFTPAIMLEGEDLFSFTARHGVGLVLAAPLAHGVLTGMTACSFPSDLSASQRLARLPPPLMKQVSEGLHTLHDHFGDAPGTLARLALRSSLQRGDNCVVVMGFSSEKEVEEGFGSLGPKLTEQELGVVDEVYSRLRAGLRDESFRSVGEEVRV
jgi:aryl-alcohol dehydrogenase-like predicted oxidoreductase